MIKKPTVGLVGAGNIGGTVAHLLALENTANVALYDRNAGRAEGKALDISHALAIAGKESVRVQGSDNFSALSGCNVLVVTAGSARKPGMSRKDLVQKNVEAFQEIGPLIQKHVPLALVVVVTNPLDTMTWVMQKACGLPHSRVIGMAGVLDSGRFASLLADALNVDAKGIHTMVLGGHGDLMVPLVSCTSVNGIPLQSFLDNGHLSGEVLADIIAKTRDGGAEIVRLLETGSAYYGPAASCVRMVKALLGYQPCLMPCSAWIGEGSAPAVYGSKDVYMGVPAMLNKEGVQRIIEVPFLKGERVAFDKSVADIQEDLAGLSLQRSASA